jgi:hypothetical protein
MRILLGLGVLAPILGLIGCSTTEPSTRPPKEPAVYRTPPDLPEYSKPLSYPKEFMEEDPLMKKSTKAAGPGMGGRPGGPGGAGPGGPGGMAGPGMGGAGMMGPGRF